MGLGRLTGRPADVRVPRNCPEETATACLRQNENGDRSPSKSPFQNQAPRRRRRQGGRRAATLAGWGRGSTRSTSPIGAVCTETRLGPLGRPAVSSRSGPQQEDFTCVVRTAQLRWTHAGSDVVLRKLNVIYPRPSPVGHRLDVWPRLVH